MLVDPEIPTGCPLSLMSSLPNGVDTVDFKGILTPLKSLCGFLYLPLEGSLQLARFTCAAPCNPRTAGGEVKLGDPATCPLAVCTPRKQRT